MHNAIQGQRDETPPRFFDRGRDFIIRFLRGKHADAPLPQQEPDASALELERWACRLEEEREFLFSFVRDVEVEFLETGESLSGLIRQLNNTQGQCHSLIDLISGQANGGAVQFAFQLLNRTEDLLLACYDQYDQAFAAFGELQQQLARLYRQNDDLRRVLMPLSFITTAFRVEAVRHSSEVQDVFLALARTVELTMNEVRGALNRQFEELAASEEVAAGQMAEVAAVVQSHRADVASTLKDSRRQLRALNDVFNSSGTRAEELARLNQTVKRHINSMVVAQQSHDITRQKIEHVGEGMGMMRGHLLAGAKVPDPHRTQERQLSYQLGLVQQQQVRIVFRELTHAADNLRSSVLSLRNETSAATSAAADVGASTRDANAAAQCQISIGAMLAIIGQAVQNNAGILKAFEPLEASFVKCTSKATELASDVRLAALNAQVFAVNSPDGAVLEVLAGRMRQISDCSFEQVNRLESSLRNTSEMISNLRERLADFQVLGQMEQEILTAEAAFSQDDFAALEEAIAVQVENIGQNQRRFADSVVEMLAGVRFPEAVAETSSRSVAFFDELIAWGAECGGPIPADSVAAKALQQMQASYTMESERVAHAKVLQEALLPLVVVSASGASECPQGGVRSKTASGPNSMQKSEMLAAPAMGDVLLETAPTLVGAKDPVKSSQAAADPDLGDNTELF